MALTRASRESFAVGWAEAWNRRDVEAVLRHFHEEVVFTSPTALAVVGAATLQGKSALRAYWNAAMAQIALLRFAVDRVLWDADRRELAIIYRSDVDGLSKRMSENLIFDAAGLVVAAEVFHGVPV